MRRESSESSISFLGYTEEQQENSEERKIEEELIELIKYIYSYSSEAS